MPPVIGKAVPLSNALTNPATTADITNCKDPNSAEAPPALRPKGDIASAPELGYKNPSVDM